ncbi:unnamed protein product [Clonostachys rhizophaga]|uniref:Uncharacterized protein n=1 Tax=Clonostachys rhizophaga TaxID=160324 RepID=A0A9N9YBZ7_9HYPO|nr:unnamed protein product [Clonostachys rhizophaga]
MTDILWLSINDITVVNFYRRPDENDALDVLLQWAIPDRCLVLETSTPNITAGKPAEGKVEEE